MSNIEIIQPDVVDLQATNKNISSQVAMLEIVDDTTFSLAGEILLEIKRRSKVVEERFAEPVSLAHKTHKSLTALRDSVLSPLKNDEFAVKNKIGRYSMEIERKRREEAETLRRQEEARLEAERMKKAETQMNNGDLKGAEKTLDAPIAPAVVRPTTQEPPKVAGVSMSDKVMFEIVAPDDVPRNLCAPDEKRIRNFVEAMGKTASIPGVRVWVEKVVSSRG